MVVTVAEELPWSTVADDSELSDDFEDDPTDAASDALLPISLP